jgi:hypothetical protein
MAYLQAPIKMDIYMELPQGIQTKHGNYKDHVLKLEKKISTARNRLGAVELIPCGQTHVHRIHNITNR